MINRQMCPIMSFQRQHHDEEFCAKEYCALWDEQRNQCCFKTQALTVAVKSSGGSGSTAQAQYIPPSSYYQTDAISDKIIDDSYQLTRDVSITPVLCERGY